MDKKNWKERNRIIFGERKEKVPPEDIEYFENLSAQQMKLLLKGRHADPDDRQNEAPTFKEFLEWLKVNLKFRAHGYAISPQRSDYRVSIEGVQSVEELITEEQLEFFRKFRAADECDVLGGVARCWYD